MSATDPKRTFHDLLDGAGSVRSQLDCRVVVRKMLRRLLKALREKDDPQTKDLYVTLVQHPELYDLVPNLNPRLGCGAAHRTIGPAHGL
jgi:hypothetical protein